MSTRNIVCRRGHYTFARPASQFCQLACTIPRLSQATCGYPFSWFAVVLEYDQLERLLAVFKDAIVVPALNKRDELRSRKADVRPKQYR